MMRLLPLSLALVGIWGCATTNGTTGSPAEPLNWAEGQYVLEGSVNYRRDSENMQDYGLFDFQARLSIQENGSMSLSSSSGYCEERQPNLVERDMRNRQRSFPCNGVTYVLKPAGETVQGRALVSLTESIRKQGECKRTDYVDGRPVCVAYFFKIDQRRAVKTGRLTVLKQ